VAPAASIKVSGVCGEALAAGGGTEGAVALAWTGLGAPLASRYRTVGAAAVALAAASGAVSVSVEAASGMGSAAAVAGRAAVVGAVSFGLGSAVTSAGTEVCPRAAAPNGEAPTSAVSTSLKLAAPRVGADCTESGDAGAVGPKVGAVRTGMRALIDDCRKRRRRIGCKSRVQDRGQLCPAAASCRAPAVAAKTAGHNMPQRTHGTARHRDFRGIFRRIWPPPADFPAGTVCEQAAAQGHRLCRSTFTRIRT
jgi:hypothetical protein